MYFDLNRHCFTNRLKKACLYSSDKTNIRIYTSSGKKQTRCFVIFDNDQLPQTNNLNRKKKQLGF